MRRRTGTSGPVASHPRDSFHILDDDGSLTDASDTTESAPLLPIPEDKSMDTLDDFVNQTIGTVFTWTVSNVIWALLGVCIFVCVSLLSSYSGTNTVLVMWLCIGNLVVTLLMAFINFSISLVKTRLARFDKEYVQCTSAFCGVVGVIGTVASTTAWKSLQDPKWELTFYPNTHHVLPLVAILLVVMLNIQWIASLVLTYHCKPFGRRNLAFARIPVAALLIGVLCAVNEFGTKQLIVCSSSVKSDTVIITSNLAITTSFALYMKSAVQVSFRVSSEHTRSYDSRRPIFNPWAFLHGAGVLVFQAWYIVYADLSTTMFIAMSAASGFAMLVTLMESFDVWLLWNTLFHVDDEENKRVEAIERMFAVSYVEARNIHSAIVQRQNSRIRAANQLRARLYRDRMPQLMPRFTDIADLVGEDFTASHTQTGAVEHVHDIERLTAGAGAPAGVRARRRQRYDAVREHEREHPTLGRGGYLHHKGDEQPVGHEAGKDDKVPADSAQRGGASVRRRGFLRRRAQHQRGNVSDVDEGVRREHAVSHRFRHGPVDVRELSAAPPHDSGASGAWEGADPEIPCGIPIHERAHERTRERQQRSLSLDSVQAEQLAHYAHMLANAPGEQNRPPQTYVSQFPYIPVTLRRTVL